MKPARLVYVVVALFSVQVSCRSAPLKDPEPFTAASAPDKSLTAIKFALSKRGWVVSKEEPGIVYATLNIRSHVAKTTIKYDSKLISIEYLSSTNLKYHKTTGGKEIIHKNYMNWVKNLAHDISRHIANED